MTFVDLGLKMMPEKESFLPQEWCQMGPFPNKAATSGHNEFQERSMVLKGIYEVGATSGLFWRACEVISFLLLFQTPTRSGF